ncbi:PLD nuclease N-terminal domain-containing protein [Catenuloplanes indicus]|uniref:Cardiolipin synthase N-terminal domain-containing protein n=1 Tax=Catenuloplanes indicus TaxID=137267 RepID=A0AAE4AZW4_9ACTN|nr:PLD nuclease N-terminal domain-containing protein [Catenuloplanes indicus]MDQ0368912.1 hypothetical protein [Catenuloplanes indicus]
MARLFALVFLLQIAMAVVALISCLSAEPEEIRRLPRLAWAAVIVLLPVAGPVLWFMAGRARPDRGAQAPRRPLAPDDDPDFLRTLDADKARRDREQFERWEEDLRRREEELRRDEDPKNPELRNGDA